MLSKHIYGPSPVLGSDNRYHYVYRITNLVEQKHYYGSRTSNISPFDDLGKKYFSSACANSWIKKDQKQHPQNYKYKILKTFATRKDAVELECVLHEKFDVGNSVHFYNVSKQTSVKFDTTGKSVVEDENGNCFLIKCDDPRYISGKLKSISCGKIYAEDSNGNITRVKPNNDRLFSGELKKVSLMTYTNEKGEYFKVKTTDDRVISGELFATSRNKVMVKDAEGKVSRIDRNNPQYISGELLHLMVGLVSVINHDGKIIKIHKSDTRYTSGELKSSICGHKNPNFKFYRKTPWGIFNSAIALEPEIKRDKLTEWCGPKNDKILSKIVYNNCEKLRKTFGPDCIGKTFKELGFANLTPEEYQQLQLSE